MIVVVTAYLSFLFPSSC